MGASFPWENLGSFPPGEILEVFMGLERNIEGIGGRFFI